MKLRKNVGKLITKYVGVKGIAAGAVSLLLVTGGFHILWEDYQNGNLFKPELFVKNRELQGNQIMFPEKEDIQDDNTNSEENDNKKLERDPGADDPYGQEKQNDTSFEMAQDQIQTNPENAGTLFTDPSMGFAGNTDGSSWLADGRNAVLSPDAEEKVNIPAGMTDISAGNENGTAAPAGQGNTSAITGGNTTVSGGSGSTGGGSGFSQEPSTTPGGNDVPSPSPTPDQPDTPDNPSDNGGNTTVVDPDYPEGSKGPQLPKDPEFSGFPYYTGTFGKDGFPAESDLAKNAKLEITSIFGEPTLEIYQGAVLTDWKILCSVYATVDTGNGNLYRIKEFSENFKIVSEYPKVADGDFWVTFAFRPNVEWGDNWQRVNYKIKVKYCKVLVMGNESQQDQPIDTLYLEKGQSVNLSKELQLLYVTNSKIWDAYKDNDLYQIVPGWIINDDITIFSNKFTPKTSGRYEIRPMDRKDVPEDLMVRLDDDWIDKGDEFEEYYAYLQTLFFCDGIPEMLEVPQGIQRVDLYFLERRCNAEKISIPRSVVSLPDDFAVIRDSFIVEKENLYYCSENGLLFNKAKTELLGIPTSKTELNISETVDKVVLPKWNSQLQKITFNSSVPPEINLTRINNAQLVVPEEYYLDYLLAWENTRGNNVIVSADGKSDYTFENGAVLSENGSVLERISNEAAGLWVVPDGVKRIKAHAADACVEVDRIFVPDSVTDLETESLNGENLEEIYFEGTTPPQIDTDTFGKLAEKEITIFVPEGFENAYIEAWGEVLGGEDAVRDLIRSESYDLEEKETGLVYLSKPTGTILAHVPKNIVSFEEVQNEIGPDIEITEIGNSAFKGCQNLKVIKLPESIVKIGRYAFSQCTNLKGLISYATDKVYVGKDAFDELEYMAYDAEDLELEDPTVTGRINTYVTYICKNKTEDYKIKAYGESYDTGDDTDALLFGLNGYNDKEYFNEAYLVTATSDFSGAINPPDGFLLAVVEEKALEGCKNEFWIPEKVAHQILYVYQEAFAGSGLTGSVAFSDDLVYLGSSAFSRCKNLTDISFSYEGYVWDGEDQGLSLGELVFSETEITSIEFPKDLKALGYGVFAESDIEKIMFTGEDVPNLVYSYGYPYSFGEEKEGMIQLTGDAETNKQAYIDQWKYNLEGLADAVDILFGALNSKAYNEAYNEWWTETGSPPENDFWEVIEEFQEYVEVYTPYVEELTPIEGEERVYYLLGETPKDLEKPEKPDIHVYIERWKQRLEEEKEEALQKKEDLLDPVKVPKEDEKKPDQEEVVEDPSKKDEEKTPEDPDGDATDPGTDEDPENPEPSAPSDPDDSGEDGSDNSDNPDNSGENGSDNSGDTDDPGNNGSDTGNEDGDNSGNGDAGSDSGDTGNDSDAGENGDGSAENGSGDDSDNSSTDDNSSEISDTSSDNETDTKN